MKKRPIILAVGGRKIKRLEKINETYYRNRYDILILLNSKTRKGVEVDGDHETIVCDFDKPNRVSTALRGHSDRIQAVVAYGEGSARDLSKIVPHLPYIDLPTSHSLEWATSKIFMRKRFDEYDGAISPRFVVARDLQQKTIEKIEKQVKYPLIVKPTNLATSLYVTKCYHRDELQAALKKIFKRTGLLQKLTAGLISLDDEQSQVIVEEYMEGKMYSIDGIVNNKGEVSLYPLVHVKTGKEAGYDDFFGYQRITPVKVNENRQEQAREIAKKAVHALKLKNTHFHLELMRLEDDWKIIEITPRQGGYRQSMYQLSYGLDIAHNEVQMRLGKDIKTNTKNLGYTAVMQIFAREEGVIAKIKGSKKIQKLDAVHKVSQKKKKGDRVLFAKNGGKAVFVVTLHHKDRPTLLAGIRRIEEELEIIVE